MIKIRSNLLIKATAFFLCIILFAVAAFMTSVSAFILYLSDGTITPDKAHNEFAEYFLNSRSNQLFYIFEDEIKGYSEHSTLEWASDEDYYFTIYDENMNVLLSNYDGQEYKYKHRNYEYMDMYDSKKEEWIGHDYYVDTYLKGGKINNNLYNIGLSIIDSYFNLTTEFLIISFFLLIFVISLIIFLCCASGYKRGVEGIYINLFNKIPLDIITAFYVALTAVELILCEIVIHDSIIINSIIMCSIFVLLDFALLIIYIMSLAARIKGGTFIKNNIIYYVLSFIYKYVKIILRSFFRLLKSIPLIPKTAAIIVLIFLINWGLLKSWYEYESIILLFVECLILVPAILYFVICLKKLQIAGQRIAKGDLEHKVDTSYMICEFKEYGETLNNIGEGLSVAVNEKIRSERLKTELITNVSHDIKTPLTSIINYVDLIKKEKPQNDNVRDYIDILDRQSNRLKKLIEDLIEASKASTGNIAVEKEPCELGILLSQTVGEFDERLKRKNLDIIVGEYKEPLTVMADRRHLWRVFDNLMSNICKYSQNGTRVYLSLNKIGNQAMVTFRNISENQLYVSGDELTERFVRGDSSRNTEGSGLGLSIAKSLVELQGGDMQIHIDGDLFKVVISFKTEEH